MTDFQRILDRHFPGTSEDRRADAISVCRRPSCAPGSRTSWRCRLRWLLRGIFFLAVACGLHALLFLAVSVRVPGPAPSVAEGVAPSQLLAPEASSDALSGELWSYIRIFDPAMLIRPRQNGFSSVLAGARPIPRTPLPEFVSLRDLSAEKKGPLPVLVTSPPTMALLVRGSWPRPAGPQLDVPAPQVIPKDLWWRTANGKLLEPVVARTPAEVAAVAEGDTPGNPSAFMVSSSAVGLRIRLVESCGVPALDRLALSDLRTALRPLLLAPGNGEGRARDVPAALVPAADAPVRLEAEWRLLLDQVEFEEEE